MMLENTKKKLADTIQTQDIEIQLLQAELIDTLEPSKLSMEACQIVLQLLMKNTDYRIRFGDNEAAMTSAIQLKRLFTLITGLNDLTTSLNELKLHNHKLHSQLMQSMAREHELIGQLSAIKKAEDWQ